ncbi:hypothetical protein DESPIGER_0903 [Desulfovibrio piger]|uniref:Uncharacterized protein n=1 Tax=Desulfovibrio piger TaxID=901 RepID=A0A1K1LDH9_9BACT|nr:hypothetical protein DESPIGER_0903 [Desulfovibrio piger]
MSGAGFLNTQPALHAVTGCLDFFSQILRCMSLEMPFLSVLVKSNMASSTRKPFFLPFTSKVL